MAKKTKIASQEEEMPETEGPETPPDRPVLDQSDAAVSGHFVFAKIGVARPARAVDFPI